MFEVMRERKNRLAELKNQNILQQHQQQQEQYQQQQQQGSIPHITPQAGQQPNTTTSEGKDVFLDTIPLPVPTPDPSSIPLPQQTTQPGNDAMVPGNHEPGSSVDLEAIPVPTVSEEHHEQLLSQSEQSEMTVDKDGNKTKQQDEGESWIY